MGISINSANPMNEMKKPKWNYAYITKTVSILSIIIGALVFAGWIFNIDSFIHLLPGFGIMKFNTSICFMLAGISLYLVNSAPEISKPGKIIATICSILILLFGVISLSQYLFNWDLDPGQLFAKKNPGIIGFFVPGNMSLIASLDFTILGTTLLLLGRRKLNPLILTLVISIFPGCFLVIMNHLFGVSFLQSIPLSANISLATALLFLVLSTGIFFSPAIGFLHFSFLQKMAGFFILILLVRGLIFFAINKNIIKDNEKDQTVEHTHIILTLAERLKLKTNEIERKTLGFIISGNADYSSYFDQSNIEVNHIIDSLKLRSDYKIVQKSSIDSLQDFTRIFMNYQLGLVNLSRRKGIYAVKQSMKAGTGDVLFKKISSGIEGIENAQSNELVMRKESNNRSIRNTSKLLSFFQLIAIFLFVIALKMIYDNSRYRNKVEGDLKNSLKDISDYKRAIDESSILIITGPDGIIRQVNDNFCKITQFKREELVGQDHRIINSGYHSKDFMRELWATINNGKIWKGEIKNKAKDGSYFWLDTTIVPFINEEGKPYQFVAIRSDITRRKKLEEEIRLFNQDLQKTVHEKIQEGIAKDQQYRFLLQNMREGIQIIGYDWKYIFVNSSALDQSGFKENDVLGKTVMEKYPGAEKSSLFTVLQRCMKDRTPTVLEHEFHYPGNTKRWFELSIQPVHDGILILSIEVTDRENARKALIESENYLRTIIATEPECVNMFNENGELLDINPAGLAMIEAENIEQVKGKHIIGLLEPPYRPAFEQLMKDVFHGASGMITFEITGFKGTKRWMEAHVVPIKNDEGIITTALSVTRDISDRKKAEEELAEQRIQQHKLLTEVALQSQEKEKNELGKELHDNINQILSTVKIYLGMMKEGSGRPSDNLLQKSFEHVSMAIDELRKLSHSLVAPSLGEIGLEDALQGLADESSLINKLQVYLFVQESYKKQNIDKGIELMFYRIVQEQLNNIIKYSKATSVEIKVSVQHSRLLLAVIDNGIGFDFSKKTKGIGFKNISSRAAFYGGKMGIISEPGKGCELMVSIPIQPKEIAHLNNQSTLRVKEKIPASRN